MLTTEVYVWCWVGIVLVDVHTRCFNLVSLSFQNGGRCRTVVSLTFILTLGVTIEK